MAVIQHAYHYPFSSSLSEDCQPRLALATSRTGEGIYPYFFQGALKQPRLSAELLCALHQLVGSRFFTPFNTLEKLGAFDPVVTSGGGLLRFEGFSACCSAYIRVDMLPESYDGDIVGKGTTNVDFNAAMRAALARVRDVAGLSFSVGGDEFVLQSGMEQVIEKKVALPLRWVRGMLEVQSYLAAMRKYLEVNGHEALRFFRTLPKASTSRTTLWVVNGPFGLRTTTRKEASGVRLADVARLRVLEPLLTKAQSLSIYADDAQQASAWVLTLPGVRLTLALSAEVGRGFSGEGQALRALMQASDAAALPRVRAHLQWQPALAAQTVAHELALDRVQVEDILRVLGVSGLVGFDLVEGAYFHRVLPFDLSLVEDMHPRLADARSLIEEGAVHIVRDTPLEAWVQSAGIEHHLREVDGELRCTCPWFAKYQGERGPCKHVLAVEACRKISAYI